MKVVYYGDSITQGFELLKKHENVVNLGVGGDKIINLLGRYFEVHEANPNRIIMMIGINDYLCMRDYWQLNVEFDIPSLFDALLDLITTNLPDTEIYILSILPVSMDIPKKDLELFNSDIDTINKVYKELADEYGVNYLDINSKFLKDGILDHKYTEDGVHLNEMGYELYYSLVKHLLGDD